MPDLSSRIQRTQQVLKGEGLDAFLVGPSADMFWLIGYHAPLLERLTLLVVPADGTPVLVVPELEAARAKASGAADLVEVETWGERDDPVAAVTEAMTRHGHPALRLAVQDRLWASFLLQLQTALPDADWTSGKEVARALRLRKAPDEIAALRAAGAAIDRVHEQIPGLLRPGRTESEVGRDIADLILEDHDSVAFVIVASGPNGASPHHETAHRRLERGDAIVVDIGGVRDGYCSDMTRNYVIGDPPEGYTELHDVLLEAQKAGVSAVRPGVSAESVDAACRDVLDAAGYGEYFIHRTGHGIGVEVHEDPYLVGGNTEILDAGMAFSVEPGIYVPGRYGARIEDIVVVTEDGVDRVNRLERDLVVVPAGEGRA